MGAEKIITPALVRELFDYDQESGVLTWRFHEGKTRNYRVGREAGSITKPRDSTGVAYRKIGIRLPGTQDRQLHVLAHRVAWAHVHGEWPADQIDHIDGNGLNNSLGNLRVTDRSINARNQHLHANNTSGVAGVVWHQQTAKWQAGAGTTCQATKKRRFIHLGLHSTLLDAVAARKSYDLKHGYGPAHGSTMPKRTAV